MRPPPAFNLKIEKKSRIDYWKAKHSQPNKVMIPWPVSGPDPVLRPRNHWRKEKPGCHEEENCSTMASVFNNNSPRFSPKGSIVICEALEKGTALHFSYLPYISVTYWYRIWIDRYSRNWGGIMPLTIREGHRGIRQKWYPGPHLIHIWITRPRQWTFPQSQVYNGNIHTWLQPPHWILGLWDQNCHSSEDQVRHLWPRPPSIRAKDSKSKTTLHPRENSRSQGHP